MNDAVKRGLRTFLQAAVAVLVAAGTGYVDIEVWKGAGLAGGMAVLSYLQNLLEDKSVVPTVLK